MHVLRVYLKSSRKHNRLLRVYWFDRTQNENIPFNLLIVDCGSRIFLFPQCFAQRKADNQLSEAILDTQVNPAAFEICGHMVLKRKEDYEGISESFIWNLLEAASLDKDAFENVIKLCMM